MFLSHPNFGMRILWTASTLEVGDSCVNMGNRRLFYSLWEKKVALCWPLHSHEKEARTRTRRHNAQNTQRAFSALPRIQIAGKSRKNVVVSLHLYTFIRSVCAESHDAIFDVSSILCYTLNDQIYIYIRWLMMLQDGNHIIFHKVLYVTCECTFEMHGALFGGARRRGRVLVNHLFHFIVWNVQFSDSAVRPFIGESNRKMALLCGPCH